MHGFGRDQTLNCPKVIKFDPRGFDYFPFNEAWFPPMTQESPSHRLREVNVAAGEFGQFKEEEFSRDTGEEDQARLTSTLDKIIEFCVSSINAICFLVEKDIANETTSGINELVDLKFLHRAKSLVTVRDRTGRRYDAYMLEISRYTGERTRRNLKIVKFWGRNSDDALRRTALIYLEKDGIRI
jgi:hypothetical protein